MTSYIYGKVPLALTSQCEQAYEVGRYRAQWLVLIFLKNVIIIASEHVQSALPSPLK